MNSTIEQKISLLWKGQFGPNDPRVPSIFSRLGGQLSFDNQAKILEAQKYNEEYLHKERVRSENERHAYWSDNQHLTEKLQSTIQSVSTCTHASLKQLTETYAIVKGTGQVVTKRGEAYHYVEVDTHEAHNPVYISGKATLPESQFPHVISALELGIVYTM